MFELFRRPIYYSFPELRLYFFLLIPPRLEDVVPLPPDVPGPW